MSHPAKYLPLVLLTLAAACGRDDTGTESGVPECEGGPSANAGPDQTVSLAETVSLNGAASNLCEDVAYKFVWGFESVPVESEVSDASFTQNNSDDPDTQFTPDVEGTYVISLELNDVDAGTLTAPDIIIVEVASGNQPPMADCGEDQTVAVGDRVSLDGTGSSDPEGARLSYQWALSSVPDESVLGSDDLYNSGAPEATVIPDVPGLYLVALVVTDGINWSEPDYCSVTATSSNRPPVADAGTGGLLPPCSDDEIILNGYGSWDPEGATIAYLWSLISAPKGSKTSDASFDDRTSPTPHFTWDVSGTYSFQLLVNDGETDSAPDVVTYTIQDRSFNNPPVANAGADQSISNSTDCTTSSYTWTCEDCEPDSVELDGTASVDPDGDDVHHVWSEDSGEITFATPYAAFTMATTPSVPAIVGTTVRVSWNVTLHVSDCAASDEDEVIINYACTGNRDYGP